MGDRMVPKQIRLTQQQNLFLKSLAKERSISESAVIRHVLACEIQREEKSKTKPKG